MGDFRHQWRVFLIGLGFLSVSCSPFTSKKPPVVLIALESFSEQDFLCADSRRLETLPHLQEVCDEFIRFTHAYAPSSMTQANISSLFTGLDIPEHGVTNNGASGISARLQTLGEQALNLKMRTGFFSGGVPVLNKFGVSQGFEEFNEAFWGEDSRFFRPFAETTRRAIRWLDEEVKGRSFFLTLYAPDLLYKNRVTKDGLDNERPMGRLSEVQEIHETIDSLIFQLKKRGRWKNIHFVVLGLGGPVDSLNPFNPLSSQYLHVPLQIKLSQNVKSNLENLNTEMVSFARVGQWLHKLLSHKPSQGDLVFSPDREDRWITQKNSWLKWMQLSNQTTFGIRKRQYLFAQNHGLQVYDTFFDKNEFEPLAKEEARRLLVKFDIAAKMKSFFPQFCHKSFGVDCPDRRLDSQKLDQLSQLVTWNKRGEGSELDNDDFDQKIRSANRAQQEILLSWLAYEALSNKQWTTLFEVGKKTKRSAWTLLAQANLREPPRFDSGGCLKYFVEEKKDMASFYKHCQNPGLRKVVHGISMLKAKKRPLDGFWAQVDAIRNRRRALNLNLNMLFINDVKRPFDFAPSLSELYFFLPENADYLHLIEMNES